MNSYGCPVCTLQEVVAPSPAISAAMLRDKCGVKCEATAGNLNVFPLDALPSRTHEADITAPSKYQPCGMASELLVQKGWGDVFREHTQHLIPVGVTSDVGALQSRIRDLQEQNERLAALVDEKERTAPVVRWVALSAGWHHWPCVTTGAKVPEREPHPLHRAIAVRKPEFPRG